MPLLYDAVALGMWAYTRSAFRVETLGAAELRLEPGTIVVSTHRRETDVPLLAPSLYFHARLWGDRSRRISFAARDDMFAPGFFAGFPSGLDPRARKLLYPIAVGRFLRDLTVFPVPSATTALLDEVFRARPELALDTFLPAETVEAFRARAAEVGLPPPRTAADASRGEYADLLWLPFGRETLNAASLQVLWARRAAAAADAFRVLVEVLRRGAVLVVFPEGRPSPDGSIGPLQRGLDALVRRARPARLQPVGLAYDPLTGGRTRAFVSFAEAVKPPEEDVARAVLSLLRQATPLTCGQVVADALAEARRPALADLERAIAAAVAEGRSVERELLDVRSRSLRWREAVRAGERRRRSDLEYLAREYRSARELS